MTPSLPGMKEVFYVFFIHDLHEIHTTAQQLLEERGREWDEEKQIARL